MKGHMKDGKFHPHTDYKKGTRKSRDQKAKTQGIRFAKQRSSIFKMNDRVITTEQCFEDVFKGDKGKVVGFDKPRDLIVVEFDLHRGQQYFVPQSCIIQSERKKRYDVCQPFLDDPASHKPDDTKHTNQIMYSLGDESCASVLTDEEFSMLLTDNQVANTFSPIGETATKWQQDDAFRKRIIDRAQELIEEQKKGERKARDEPDEVDEGQQKELDDDLEETQKSQEEFKKFFAKNKINTTNINRDKPISEKEKEELR